MFGNIFGRQTVIQKIIDIVFTLRVVFLVHFSQNLFSNFISYCPASTSLYSSSTLSFVASCIFRGRQFWLGPKYFQVFIYCSQLSLHRPSTHLISHQKKNFYWIPSSHVHAKDRIDSKCWWERHRHEFGVPIHCIDSATTKVNFQLHCKIHFNNNLDEYAVFMQQSLYSP